MSDDNVTVFNPRVFEAAHVRLKTAPATLSDADLEQLAIFSPDLGLQAMEQREKALQPAPAPVPRHAPAARLDVGAIADAVIGIIKPLAARLHALEKEREREKGVGNVRWRGTYKQSEIYRSGELLTHDGGLWVALLDCAQTLGRPPEGQPAAYQLVVKNGGMR